MIASRSARMPTDGGGQIAWSSRIREFPTAPQPRRGDRTARPDRVVRRRHRWGGVDEAARCTCGTGHDAAVPNAQLQFSLGGAR